MSNYIKATNFAVKDTLSTGDTNKVVRGTEIDTEFTAIASAITSKADSNSPTFTGTPLAPTPSPGTNNTQIATTAFVATSAASSFPSGGIIMWSGSIASIPSGWYLCNGSNGTPDLRNRFIVGAGSTYSVAATGGSKDAIVVSHTHTASTASTGSHQHAVSTGTVSGQVGLAAASNWQSPGGTSLGQTESAGSHSHTVTVNSTGSSGTDANLPPYYALAYIMKA